MNKLWITVAATSLNTRSTGKLSVISAMAPHSFPASMVLSASPINEGQNLDYEINV